MKLFIWDLHGTLEIGNERAVIELSNQVLKEFGYQQRFGEQHIHDLYGMKWHQYFESLIPEADHSEHMRLQAACFDLSNSLAGITTIASYISPSRHADVVLKAIRDNHRQILISNTVPESVPLFISALGMNHYFDSTNAFAVDGHAHDNRRSKHDVFSDYIQGKAFDDYVVIGDSESDMAFAEAIGGKAYLYSHIGLRHRSKRGTPIHDLSEVLVEI